MLQSSDRENSSCASQNELPISDRASSNTRFRLYSHIPSYSMVGETIHGNEARNGRLCYIIIRQNSLEDRTATNKNGIVDANQNLLLA